MCGVIGIIGSPFSSHEVHMGLQTLQHRGQDAAGILSYQVQNNQFHLSKDTGLVAKVFNQDKLNGLPGEISIGHTRYATVGPKNSVDAKRDIQPMMINYPYGIGMVHNGNLINFNELREKLKKENQRQLFTQNDLEALLNLLAKNLLNHNSENKNNVNFEEIKESVFQLFDQVEGGYAALSVVGGHGLLAFRDPHGIRPLVLGKRKLLESEVKINFENFGHDHLNKNNVAFKDSYILSSETNALQFLGYEFVRDIQPGEVLLITHEGQIFSSQEYSKTNKIPQKTCMFEWIYFSNPESILENQSVYQARLKFGEALGRQIEKIQREKHIDIDVIVPIPDTSRVAAISLSETLKIPYRELLIKNRYIQRSFILNTQENRKMAVSLKLSAITHEIKGKNILLVDDSIVRGTTSQKIIQLVRAAGANKVYLASTCPPIRHPCFYGVDFPDPTELIAYNKSETEISPLLGADEVFYLTQTSLIECLKPLQLCMACIDGEYPVGKKSIESFSQMRKQQRETLNQTGR